MAEDPVVEEHPIETLPAGEAPPETPPAIPPEGDQLSPSDDLQDEGKPGGDGPQAVRARREYQARKKAQQDLQAERLDKARLEERLKVLEEQSKQKTSEPEQKVYTIPDLQAAVDAGTINQAEMTAYLVKQETKRIQEEERQKAEALQPIHTAINEIGEYRKFLPELNSRTSETFQKASAQYLELVGRGLPKNEITEALAVQMTFGSLEKLKKQRDVQDQTRNGFTPHAEAPAGGPETPKALDISKAPADIVAIWNKTGVTPEQRKVEFKYWQEKQAARAARR